ncbi:MAG TPA: hypothetical protein VFS42_08340 [Burkholderiaceae bacterium]|nr:hypothetical protein [Burkholderiaceae bacterium]
MLREHEPKLSAHLASLTPLLKRFNDLKRIKTAEVPHRSLAQRGFARAWSALMAGDDVCAVAIREAAAAVAAVELAGMNTRTLRCGGLDDARIEAVYERAVPKAAQDLAPALLERLVQAVPDLVQHGDEHGRSTPVFVTALQDQPRAGATHPTQPRLVLEPPESHADHCYVVGVSAVILAGQAQADVAGPFLAALSHHLHNAVLPDAGFAGEALLGEHLEPLMNRLTAQALDVMPKSLAMQVRDSHALLAAPSDVSAEAFHAADVIDRVLEAAHYDEVARFRLDYALDTLELVHPGPLKPFQDRVLHAARLVI